MKNKNLLLVIVILSMVLLSGCNYIKYGFPNCKHDNDCKIDETCAIHGNEFEISVSRCEKLSCSPIFDNEEKRLLVICNEGRPPSWKYDGIGRQYIGETHNCMMEERIQKFNCRKVKLEEIEVEK